MRNLIFAKLIYKKFLLILNGKRGIIMKFKKIMSVVCALSIAGSMAVMPVFADTATSGYDYEVKYYDDGTDASHIVHAFHPYKAVNSEYGFIHATNGYQTFADHYFMFDYGVKGSTEITFDYFADDIDYDVTNALAGANEFRTRVLLEDSDGNKSQVFVDGRGNAGYTGTLAKDNGEA